MKSRFLISLFGVLLISACAKQSTSPSVIEESTQPAPTASLLPSPHLTRENRPESVALSQERMQELEWPMDKIRNCTLTLRKLWRQLPVVKNDT